jgi:hypothetical protein
MARIFLRKTLFGLDPILLAEDALPEENGSRRGAEAVHPLRSAPGSLQFEAGILREASESGAGNAHSADLKKFTERKSPGISFARNR